MSMDMIFVRVFGASLSELDKIQKAGGLIAEGQGAHQPQMNFSGGVPNFNVSIHVPNDNKPLAASILRALDIIE